MIERIGVKPTYSEAVICNGMAHLSGQVPWKSAGQEIGLQVAEVLELVDERLKEAASDRTKIISMQIFLKNSEDYPKMNEIFLNWIPEGFSPARNTICGVQFPQPGWGVEIVVVAAV
jgi:enamine deaminase RidA (YjgF/YER057c/UK114 family)